MEDNSKNLDFIYKRLVKVYNENESTDYMLKFKKAIKDTKESEKAFKAYIKFKKSRQ
jgi:hypothetical protein